MKEIEQRIINWLIIGFFVIADFLLLPIAFTHWFPEETTILFDKIKLGDMDLLAFLGAVFGGAITLFGVLLTIKANEKQRKKDLLPQRVHRLENIIKYINDAEKEIARYSWLDLSERELIFFEIDENYGHVTTELYIKYIKDEPERIRNEAIYIDAYTYKLFLDFKQRLDSIYEVIAPAISDLNRFRENLVQYHMAKGTDVWNIKWTELELNQYQKEEKEQIVHKYNSLERQYIYQLGELFGDFKYNLEIHHTNLIHVLDY